MRASNASSRSFLNEVLAALPAAHPDFLQTYCITKVRSSGGMEGALAIVDSRSSFLILELNPVVLPMHVITDIAGWLASLCVDPGGQPGTEICARRPDSLAGTRHEKFNEHELPI